MVTAPDQWNLSLPSWPPSPFWTLISFFSYCRSSRWSLCIGREASHNGGNQILDLPDEKEDLKPVLMFWKEK
jgi:hypothetical protein